MPDDSKFPWQRPEAAPRDGWWLSTVNTPRGRAAIAEIETGDLVICQRTDPKRRGDGLLIGICAIGMTDSWNDAETICAITDRRVPQSAKVAAS